jgi:LPS-assembly protein
MAQQPVTPASPTATSPAPAGSPAPAPASQARSKANKSRPSEPKLSAGGAIDITSDHATLGVDGNATLQGNVNVRQGDRQIRGDEVHYNQKTNSFKTEGNMEYEDPIVKITGAGGNYSPDGGADVRAAQFDLRQRAARGSADALRMSQPGVIDLKGVRFTTCPKAEEAWHIKAKSVTLNTQTQIGDARSAQVDFQGVPIMYLPWLSFPLGNQRKSGFLFPTIGNSSRSGVEVDVPYYWNIAPNADLTFDPIFYTKRGADLGGDLRYLTQSQHGELKWSYLPNDTSAGQSRSLLKLNTVSELPGDFRFTINAEEVSDTSYFEDFSQGPEGTSTAFVEQLAALTYRDEHWRVDAEAQHYQTIDIGNILEQYRPYARVPSLAVSANYALGAAEHFRYGFESEVVNFQRPLGVTGWRIDALPDVSLDFSYPGFFVRPSIAWRQTQYELSNTVPGADRSPSRTLPIASIDTGLQFERYSGSHDQRRLTLEPRVLYLYVPYRNQDQLPLFDTALPDLDPVELFRNNRYVGADRVGDANQVSVGVTSRLLDAHDGKQFLSATLGQTYYFTDPRVVLPYEVPRTDLRSDFVAQFALTAYKNWSADFGLQWDPQASRSERTQVNVQYRPSPQEVINVGYRYQRTVLGPTDLSGTQPQLQLSNTGVEQVEVSAAWPIGQSWNAYVRGVYSFKDDKPLERFAGFEYRACCWKIRLGGRSFINRDRTQDTGVYLQLELTGLASVGSESDSFLTEAIPGFTPVDSAPQRPRAP